MSKNICVDLDGTLAYYTTWKDMDGRIGEPRPGAKEFLRDLKTVFDKVIIFTARLSEDNYSTEMVHEIEHWFAIHELPYSELYTGKGKPICEAFIDDRAVGIPKNPVESDYDKVFNAVCRFVELE